MSTRILIIAHAPLAHALRECALHVFADSAHSVLAFDVPPQAAPEDTLADVQRLLAPGGAAILEIGHQQRISVSQLAEAAGFAVACRRDIGGRDRALVLTRPK